MYGSRRLVAPEKTRATPPRTDSHQDHHNKDFLRAVHLRSPWCCKGITASVTIEVTVKKEKDGYWLQFMTRFDAADIMLDGLTTEQKKKMKSAGDANIEVANTNQRFSPWAYRIPEYKAKDFITGTNQLLVKDDRKS